MASIKFDWSESYEIGIPEVDEQHKSYHRTDEYEGRG